MMELTNVRSLSFWPSSWWTSSTPTVTITPSTVNENLYRKPPANTPLTYEPPRIQELRLLGREISHLSNHKEGTFVTKDDYIEKIKGELQNVRYITFHDDLDLLVRRLIDVRAYMGIKAWDELKSSPNSRLFAKRNNVLGPIHAIYLLDSIDKSEPIPKDSKLYNYLNSKEKVKKKVIEELTEELFIAYANALRFLQVNVLSPLCYPGVVNPGFVIAKKDNADMSSGGFLGIEVNYELTEKLLEAIEEKDYQKAYEIACSIESKFVHEIAHHLQNTSGSHTVEGVNVKEIGPYALHFLHSFDRSPDAQFVLPFDFATRFNNNYGKGIIHAMKYLYKALDEVSLNERMGLFFKPKSFNPNDLKRALHGLQYQPHGLVSIDDLVRKIKNATLDELISVSSQVPDLPVETTEKIPFGDSEISIISDGLMVSDCIVALRIDDTGTLTREVRLSTKFQELLSDNDNPKHKLAEEKLQLGIAFAKTRPFKPTTDTGEKLNAYEYVVRRIQNKLKIQQESSAIKETIDKLIESGSYNEAFVYTRDTGTLTDLEETVFLWDYEDSPSVVNHMYI